MAHRPASRSDFQRVLAVLYAITSSEASDFPRVLRFTREQTYGMVDDELDDDWIAARELQFARTLLERLASTGEASVPLEENTVMAVCDQPGCGEPSWRGRCVFNDPDRCPVRHLSEDVDEA